MFRMSSIPGLWSGFNPGYGLAEGLDGYIYTPTGIGLQRFSAAQPGSAQTLPGTAGGQGYGITTLPDGRIAYVAGPSTNEVYLYNPSTTTNMLIYTAPALIDDIEASATGAIALALQPINAITIISDSGAVINSLTSLPHHPDGLAFGDGVTADWLYSNNNYGLNGSTSGVGTHWDNGITNAEASIIRIAAIGTDGTEICGFGNAVENSPEPSTLSLVLKTSSAASGRHIAQ